MPYQIDEICYPDTASALAAFKAKTFMDVTLSGSTAPYIWYVNSNATISASGLLNFTLTRSMGGLASSGHTLQLPACDEIHQNAFFDKIPVQDMLFAGFFIGCFALGFLAAKK